MKAKTVYRCSIQQRKNYWVSSPNYDSFEELMKVITPWIKEHSRNVNIHFFTQVELVEDYK